MWADLGGQLGLPGLLVPAEYGGAGCGLAEAGVVLQELGRGLASVPYLSSAVLAVTALLASGDEAAQAELLPGLATGDLIGAVAVSGPGGRADGTPELARRDRVALPRRHDPGRRGLLRGGRPRGRRPAGRRAGRGGHRACTGWRRMRPD